ncbi:hypothetical protein LCGC14_0840770 [marine sediment metagenome]|uniref:Uncharacterized protein n=1 Tax=marine sediment metagenome TaxID=412755 RepID=A0A0F9PHZ9_9ZZZZ
MQKIWKWLNHNRHVVIFPVVGLMLWAYALGCTPLTMSPLDPGRMVNVTQLDLDFKTWQSQQEIMAARFEAAGLDLEQQKENNEKLKTTLLGLATGGVPDVPGLLKLLIGGGGLGAIVDNIRKGGVIGGLKRKRESA